MSPSIVTIDNTPDFDFASDFNPAPTKQTKNGITPTTTQNRTLLLAPPSIAAQGTSALPTFDRDTTDLQMLDRLYAGLVTLPAATYDLVLLLTGTDGARHAEATGLLSRSVFASLVDAMKSGASLRTQDGRFDASESREAVLAGLVQKDGGYEKVEEEEVVVPLRFGKKKTTPAAADQLKNNSNGNGAVHSSAGPAVDKVMIDVAGKPKTLDMVPPAVKPVAGVGFDFGDDFDDDDELIDEDELMTEEDLNRPVQMRKVPTSRRYTRTYSCTHTLLHMLTYQRKQPRSASPSPARSAAPARTAPAAWRSASRPRTRPAAPRRTRTSTRSSSSPRTSTSWTLRSRARRAAAAAVPSATPSAAPTAPTSGCRPSSPARRLPS